MAEETQGRTQRAVFVAVAVVIAIVAVVLVAHGSGDASTAAHHSSAVEVVGGKPQGGVQVLAYRKGERVELNVSSDRPDIVHVHGYNLREPVRMGGTARMSFLAGLEGEFRIELERTKQQIAALRVRP